MLGEQNGNGSSTQSRGIKTAAPNNTPSIAKSTDIDDLMELPPWLKALRESMGSAIKGDDLQQIMSAQIEKAKDGDRRAADFVFRQAHQMLRAGEKRVTVVQNNFYGAEDPAEPNHAKLHTDDRIKKLGTRASAQLPIATPIDRPAGLPPVMSDDEEKEFRRRQQREEEAD